MNILVIGGSASGKSSYAEERAVSLSEKKLKLVYVATLNPKSGGDTSTRIEKHREMRKNKNFITVECSGDLRDCKIPFSDSVVLLEDVCNVVANKMFSESSSFACYDDKNVFSCEKVVHDILFGFNHLKKQCAHLVVVTNDVSADGLCFYNESAKSVLDYVKVLGKVNAAFASECSEVIETVSGVPLFIKRS